MSKTSLNPLNTRKPLTWCLIAILGIAGFTSTSSANDSAWHTYPIKPPIADAERSVSEKYVTMSDGTRIAISVYLPATLPGDATLPTLLTITRYMRSANSQARIPNSMLNAILANGYALVYMDVRGTGASFGRWSIPWSPQEVADYGEVMDWITAQPWSNGNIGTFGMSYLGGAAELAALTGRKALKAAMPMFSHYDVYTDIMTAGGIQNSTFLKTWTAVSKGMDAGELNAGSYSLKITPVDETLLPEALAEHAYNGNTYQNMIKMNYRDDYVESDPELEVDDISPHHYLEIFQASDLPMYGLTGWYDSVFTLGSIKRFQNVKSPGSKLTIGPWKHALRENATPRGGNPPSKFNLATEVIRYFDEHLKGVDTGLGDEAPVQYYTVIENTWKHADTWPPASDPLVLYTAKDGRLSERNCLFAGTDEYTVNYTSTIGLESRWSMINAPAMALDDMHPEGAPVLSYISEPLDADTEVTGHPSATLYIDSTQADGQFFVYLEDVGPDGRANYVTEGQLRGLHRAVSPAPYETSEIYHSFLRKDAALMEPGKVEEIRISLLPISYLFQKGHSIRVVLTGADAANFEPPATAPAQWKVRRCGSQATQIALPVIPR